MRRRSWLNLFAVLLATAAAAAVCDGAHAARAGLFGSVEFAGAPLSPWEAFAARWMESLDRLRQCADAADLCADDRLRPVIDGLGPAREGDALQQLRKVNRLANRWPYRADAENFGRPDHWATPAEFLARSGDCEDYAIFKYSLLRLLGFPPERLRVVLVRQMPGATAHAVLAAYVGDRVYILDNATDAMLPQDEVAAYVPVYSFNEVERWAHIARGAGRSWRLP